MTFQEASLAEIRERLTKLDRQNRRLKLCGGVALALIASLFLMAQASPRKTVEANEFVLKDGNGKVRGRLAMGDGVDSGVPILELIDERGTVRLRMQGGLGRVGDAVNISGMSLFDEHARERAFFDANEDGGALGFENVKGSDDTLVRGEEIRVSGPVTVSDAQGFEATLGTTDLVTPRTGETHKTSAASLTLFDKHKNVIWQAP